MQREVVVEVIVVVEVLTILPPMDRATVPTHHHDAVQLKMDRATVPTHHHDAVQLMS